MGRDGEAGHGGFSGRDTEAMDACPHPAVQTHRMCNTENEPSGEFGTLGDYVSA